MNPTLPSALGWNGLPGDRNLFTLYAGSTSTVTPSTVRRSPGATSRTALGLSGFTAASQAAIVTTVVAGVTTFFRSSTLRWSKCSWVTKTRSAGSGFAPSLNGST